MTGEPTSEFTHFKIEPHEMPDKSVLEAPKQAAIKAYSDWVNELMAQVKTGKITEEEFVRAVAGLMADRESTASAAQNESATLEQMIRTDPLTGLGNKFKFEEDLGMLEKFGDDYALLMGDLDGFRDINNTYGHSEGDRAITLFAHRLAQLVEKANKADATGSLKIEAYRIHGDETAIIVRGKISPGGLNELSNTFVKGVEGEVLEIGGVKRRLTSSFGGAVRKHGDGTDTSMFVDSVDKHALYRAKDLGKNRSYILGYHDRPGKTSK